MCYCVRSWGITEHFLLYFLIVFVRIDWFYPQLLPPELKGCTYRGYSSLAFHPRLSAQESSCLFLPPRALVPWYSFSQRNPASDPGIAPALPEQLHGLRVRDCVLLFCLSNLVHKESLLKWSSNSELTTRCCAQQKQVCFSTPFLLPLGAASLCESVPHF